MVVNLTEYPSTLDWAGVYRRALVTIGKVGARVPTVNWMKEILAARHSPIRYLRFSFYLEIPYWVSVHLCRHVHAQPYIQSQRNDRQGNYDRNEARQDETVRMILDMNAEELLVIANKRLCNQASKETREVVRKMCDAVVYNCPEFDGLLVPMCVYHGGKCHEMHGCGMNN